ncbi:hypothetical protein EcWSU1_02010 [Enterobacter ludwigii]|uniref:Transposase n=1 Tax=Enterobacter ludwigii TaxID=299767 RepID=G8LN30_9ENTR|nr:hypothetical protein EcWSU1_02010 [Enterobacter ludwigii]
MPSAKPRQNEKALCPLLNRKHTCFERMTDILWHINNMKTPADCAI